MNFKTFRLLQEEFSRQVNSQLGSNPGGIYTHHVTGKQYYIKFPANIEQAKVEVAAARIYKHLGIKTLDPELKDISGRIGVITPWREDLRPSPRSELIHKAQSNPEHFLVHHVAAALVGNRDHVGLDVDNILHHENGDSYSIDQGGSMHFRAMGEYKEFEDDAKPLYKSLIDPKRTAGTIFCASHDNTTEDQHKKALSTLSSLTDDKIDNIIKSVSLDQKYADTIKARRDSLLNMK